MVDTPVKSSGDDPTDFVECPRRRGPPGLRDHLEKACGGQYNPETTPALWIEGYTKICRRSLELVDVPQPSPLSEMPVTLQYGEIDEVSPMPAEPALDFPLGHLSFL